LRYPSLVPLAHKSFSVAYLAAEEAAIISRAVFDITASGQIVHWSEPAPLQMIKKDESPWMMEALVETVLEKLLKETMSTATVSDVA
jgi:hypothetical protein